MKSPDIAILLLAAGASSRMGTPKQLLPWKGSSVIEHLVATADASKAANVLVVLGAGAGQIRSQLGEGTSVIENRSWQKGLGSSVACGLEHLLQKQEELGGVLVMLGDQPLVDTTYLDKMIESFRRGKKGIVASSYGSGAGVPAIFGERFFPELLALDKDSGAKKLMKKYAKEVQLLHAGIRVRDIDIPQDYERLRAYGKG